MIESHLLTLLAFAGLTSTVLALIYRPRGQRVRYGLVVFAAFVLGTVAMGWLMSLARTR